MFFDRCFQDGLFDALLVISEHFRAPLGADFGSFGHFWALFWRSSFEDRFGRILGEGRRHGRTSWNLIISKDLQQSPEHAQAPCGAGGRRIVKGCAHAADPYRG